MAVHRWLVPVLLCSPLLAAAGDNAQPPASRVQSSPASDASATQSVDRELQTMDADRDGRLSQTEHDAGAQRMFVTMDGDRDGVVTAEEMESNAPASAQSLSAQARIKAVDRNGDGKLSVQEHAAGSRDMFGKMDGDQDGHLTQREIQMARDEMLSTDKPQQKPH